ncbi:MAG TPA: CAP domain-containing protein [Actinomycetota bacterium]
MSVLARTSVAPAIVAAMVAAAPAAAAGAPQLRADERLARSLINSTREERNRPSLEVDGSLSKLARRHSRAMAREGEIFHRDDLTEGLSGITWSLVGENVGVGSSVRQVQKAFMHSPPHRHNLLNRDFDEIGIGVVAGEGRSWVTLIFLG